MPITIKVRENGPLFIAPEFVDEVVLVDHAGNRIETKPGKGIALCRCGASVNKPFCDGTHSRIGFVGAEAAQRATDAAQKAAGAVQEAVLDTVQKATGLVQKATDAVRGDASRGDASRGDASRGDAPRAPEGERGGGEKDRG